MDNHPAPTLVLLPGLDGTGRLFEPLTQELSGRVEHQVVAYPADKPLRVAEYAQLVAQHLPATPVVLLAESFSGLVALSLLGQQPRQIRHVIFCAGFAEPPRPFLLRFAPLLRHAGPAMRAAPAFLLRQFCLGPDASSAQLAWLRDVLAEVSPAVLAHRLQLIAARHAFLNSHFDIPCSYLQAEDDRLVPSGATRWFERHFASFVCHSIAGPHFLLQTNPQECAVHLLNILKTLDTQPAET